MNFRSGSQFNLVPLRYANLDDGRALLADRIEGLIPQEHAKWVSARQEREETDHG